MFLKIGHLVDCERREGLLIYIGFPCRDMKFQSVAKLRLSSSVDTE